MCFESFQQTLKFCPECLEPGLGSMTYLMADAATDSNRWTWAWDEVGLPYGELASHALFRDFPNWPFRRLSVPMSYPTGLCVRRSSCEGWPKPPSDRERIFVRGPSSRRLLNQGQEVVGVETAAGEHIPARLVILAGNAKGGALSPGFGTEAVGSQRDVALVALKAHLVAIQPRISPWPLCVVDAEGFNHVPHQTTSVFGNNRWLPARDAEDEQAFASEIDRLWNSVRCFFPDFSRDDHRTLEWAGTTIQAMHVEQIQPGQAPWPTVVDHEREHPAVKNLLSVFPGRASLWAYLAEQAQKIVFEKLEVSEPKVAAPPWGSLIDKLPLDEGIAVEGSDERPDSFL